MILLKRVLCVLMVSALAPTASAAVRALKPFEIRTEARFLVTGKRFWRPDAKKTPPPGIPKKIGLAKFEFDKIKTLSEIQIWNANSNPKISVKKIDIYLSDDGKEWQLLKSEILPKGKPGNKVPVIISCDNKKAGYVLINIVSGYLKRPLVQLDKINFLVNDNTDKIISSYADRIPEPILTIQPKCSIAIARTYPRGLPDKPLFTDADVKRIKSMGFDSIKILITIHHNMDGSNLIGQEFLKSSIDLVVKNNLPCIVCVHPQPDFKKKYFGNETEFAKLCKWYENMCAFLVENWSEKQVVFQMMTEPNYASPDPDVWNYFSKLQHRMWSSIRKTLPPAYTVILGGDNAGNLEALYFITPVKDSNVMYSFTHHIPHFFAFHGRRLSRKRHWDKLKGISWPAEDGIEESKLDTIVSAVPEEHRAKVRKDAEAYYTAGWGYKKQEKIMHGLKEWSEYWGSKMKIICVEFGCADRPDQDRYRFIHDLRRAMEANNIDWIYWAYNSSQFTVYLPGKNMPGGGRPADEEPLDQQMLDALLK